MNISMAIQKAKMDEQLWDILYEQSIARSGPFDGACLICAKALILAFGEGNLVRITSNANDEQTEHYGAELSGKIYDFDGSCQSADTWIMRFKTKENINDRKLFFRSGFDAKSAIPDDPHASKLISKLLVQHSQA